MKERFRLKTSFGEKIVEIKVMYYVYGNGLCLKFLEDGECYGYATVNFENKLPKYMAYVDTNDMPYIEEFIEKYRLGTNTGMYMKSGFCKYPLYHFDKAILQKIDKKGVNLYESHNKESYEKGNDKLWIKLF